MVAINTSFADFFAEAETILTNALQQPSIAAALAALGYDVAKIQEGVALLNLARNLYDAQIKAYGEQHAATQAFAAAFQQANQAYATHRKLAKLAFKTDPQRQTDLHLNDRKPRAFAPWYEQARHFYTALLSDPTAQTQLAQYRVTLDALQTAQAQVEACATLNSVQEREKGEAQAATKQRNAAIKALDEWLSDFRVIARIALQETPQLLEALTMRVR